MVIAGADVGGQFHELVDLFIGQGQLLFVVLVMASDAAGVGIHDFLHGFFQLFHSEEAVRLTEGGVVFGYLFGEDGFFLGFIEAGCIAQALAAISPSTRAPVTYFCGQPPATSPAA